MFQTCEHFLDTSADPPPLEAPYTPYTLEHWLDCAGTLHVRMDIFNTTSTLNSLDDSGQIGRSGKRKLQRLGAHAIDNSTQQQQLYHVGNCND